MKLDLNVNGKPVSVDVPADMPLLWVLRDVLNLPGTKFGCGEGQCGACTVHLRGRAVKSCQVPVSTAAGAPVVTIEGLSASASHPLQQAWMELDVPQCGYCQAGQIMAAAALLQTNPTPDRRGHRYRDERQPLPLRHLPPHPRRHSSRRGHGDRRQEIGAHHEHRHHRSSLLPSGLGPRRRRPHDRRLHRSVRRPARAGPARADRRSRRTRSSRSRPTAASPSSARTRKSGRASRRRCRC